MATGTREDWRNQIHRALLSTPLYSSEWFFWKGAEMASLNPGDFPPTWPQTCLKLALEAERSAEEFERDLRIERAWETTRPLEASEWDPK